jgi:GNAT superfamily N-acetyltransferase
MEDITLEPISPKDIHEAARVISIALVTTSNSIALWGGQSETHRQRVEQAVRLVNLENPRGYTLVARLGERIVGALHWIMWPNCQLTFLEALKMTRAMLPVTRWETIRATRLQIAAVRLDPQKPHWHLGPIGVLPELQGRGIGGKIIRRVYHMADQEKIACYLETDQPSVVISHQRLGFVVLKEVELLGVHNWLMWREPQEQKAV